MFKVLRNSSAVGFWCNRSAPNTLLAVSWQRLAGKSWLARVLAAILALLMNPVGFSCPSAVMNSEFPVALAGSRDQVRLFAVDSTKPSGTLSAWVELPFQLDPVEDDGRFSFFNDEHWRNAKIGTHDRLVFYTSGFGRRRAVSDSAPCNGKIVYQFQDKESSERFAYLALCESKGPAFDAPNLNSPAVAYLKDKSTLSTSQYTYDFNPKNQMLFNRISIGKDATARKTIASDSELLIKSDVKNFFTMRFDSTQIESYLEETRPGLVGTLARVSFYLKILFFKIKMSLTTDVTFYDDVGHIPMVVQLPVDARKYLNSRSGILYSWKMSPDVAIQFDKIRMPMLDPGLIEQGQKSLSKMGLKNCSGEYCQYSFGGAVDDRSLIMEFEIPMYMVKAGFFPQLVTDLKAHNEAMGWGLSDKYLAEGRIGLYFEVSGLAAGGHPWDFWLRLGASGPLEGTCPRGLNIMKM